MEDLIAGTGDKALLRNTYEKVIAVIPMANGAATIAKSLFLLAFRSERQSPGWQVKLKAETDYPHRYTEITLKPLDDEHTGRPSALGLFHRLFRHTSWHSLGIEGLEGESRLVHKLLQ